MSIPSDLRDVFLTGGLIGAECQKGCEDDSANRGRTGDPAGTKGSREKGQSRRPGICRGPQE